MAIQSVFIVSDNYAVLPEFCAGAKNLADSVTAVVFGDENTAKEHASCGADKIIFCPVSEEGAPEDYAAPIAALVKEQPKAIVMVNNSIRGRCLAGKLSVYLDTAVLGSVNEISVENDTLSCRRVVYGGTAQRKESFTGAYGVITISSGIFEAPAEVSGNAEVLPIAGEPSQPIHRISCNEKKKVQSTWLLQNVLWTWAAALLQKKI